MDTTVENDIRKLHVIGTAGVAARLGLPGTDATGGQLIRFVLAAPRTYRIRGEIIALPHVIGVANRPLRSSAAVQPKQVAPAA